MLKKNESETDESMLRFDYSHYEQLLHSFNFDDDDFNPENEAIEEYLELTENFDLMNHPPEPESRRDFIIRTIVPVMKHYARTLRGILTVDISSSQIVLSLICTQMVVLDTDSDLKQILFFASSMLISAHDKDSLELDIFFDL